jgi:DNA-binding transcriptional LysR family regulator
MTAPAPAPFDFNLRHLRALAAIAAHRSMSAAAEAVNLSQPALTQGLGKIERQLGVALFHRSHAGMTPTPEGEAVAARVEAAMTWLARATRGAARRGNRGFSRPEQLMTATQLHAFLAVADSGGFASAAVATGLSQPAIHRAVRDLEQLVGVPLVERRGRGVAITAAGRALARGARLAAGEIAAAIVEAQAIGTGGHGGRITVGAMPLSRAHLLPAAIAQLMRESPATSINVVEGSWRELIEPLRDGAIDLTVGALRFNPVPPDVVQEPLFDDRLVVVGRAGHPLAGSATVSIDQLARFPWIVNQAETPLRGHWDALFAGHSRPAAPVECGSVMTIRGILTETDALTLLSPDQIALEVNSAILALIGPPLAASTRTIGITTRPGWRPTAMQARFLDLLREHARPRADVDRF